MDETRYLTAAEVGERLGISLRTVRRRIADGSLPSVKIGGTVRVPAAVLEPPEAVWAPELRQHAAREVAASYGTESHAAYITRWNHEHWPDTYERMLGRRREAFAELERLSTLTKPPSGPHDTIDALLDEERDEFGERLLQFIPEVPKDDDR